MQRPAHIPDELVVDYDGLGDSSIKGMHAVSHAWPGPVLWTDRNDGHWLVTSAAGCRQVLSKSALFSTSANGVSLALIERERTIPLELDGSEHRAYRRAINPLFAPARVRLLDQEIRVAARELLGAIRVRGECDVVSDYARPLASSMFLRLMDWPLSDRSQLEEWVEMYLNGYAGATAEDVRRVKIESYGQVVAYCREQVAQRRNSTADDMTAEVMRAEIDGERIGEKELVGMLALLMVAGLDTTQSVISQSVEFLATHPEAQQSVRSTDVGFDMMVEELLRFGAPAMPNRTAVMDTVLDGVPIARGERVHVMLPVGNRDGAEFPLPDSVDFDRSVNRHLTFGLGPHKCIGASLARVVVAAALQELHQAIPSYCLLESSSHIGGVWGMSAVRIAFTPQPGETDRAMNDAVASGAG